MNTLTFAHAPTQEELRAIKDLAFFVQTVLHLNPPRGLQPEARHGYLIQADKVQELLKEVE